MKLIRIFLFTLMIALSAFQLAAAQGDDPLAVVMTAEGTIMPPMLEYFKRGIETAENSNADVLVIQLNTPGGSIETMLDIIQTMRASKVPIVVYVSPNDAMAGSAGALITMAGHASAMAPKTAIGAASPIDSSGADIESTLETKIKEILKAKARVLVEARGEEATRLAEAMIDDAKAVTASEALEAKLIDFVSDDTEDLLQALNGFTVKMDDGSEVTLNTENIRTEELGISFIEQLLMMLTDPNIAFILLAIGVQGILIEISSPGGWFAGFLGAVCLTLAVYGMGVLTVNWFGFIFLVIAFVLFILDIKAAAHGALTTAGVASFIVGALVLFNSPGTPQFQRVSVPLVIGVGVFIGALFFAIVLVALRSRHNPIQTGVESLLGKTGTAKTFEEEAGQVQVGSELWSAEKAPGSESIRKGDPVEVVEVRGLRLIVKKK
ncbi:MAG TPA: nodulation protein NfeD [Anaerolineales bacterium]|nr:nodulation protein NfeD [Anaerolineales bacterium]